MCAAVEQKIDHQMEYYGPVEMTYGRIYHNERRHIHARPVDINYVQTFSTIEIPSHHSLTKKRDKINIASNT